VASRRGRLESRAAQSKKTFHASSHITRFGSDGGSGSSKSKSSLIHDPIDGPVVKLAGWVEMIGPASMLTFDSNDERFGAFKSMLKLKSSLTDGMVACPVVKSELSRDIPS
jgi:hypothetical protein